MNQLTSHFSVYFCLGCLLLVFGFAEFSIQIERNGVCDAFHLFATQNASRIGDRSLYFIFPQFCECWLLLVATNKNG